MSVQHQSASFGHYSDAEWGLLVGLPQAVAVAASSAERDSKARTRTELATGMATIEEGRNAPSELIRRIASDAVAQIGDTGSDDPDADEVPLIELADPESGIADVLDRARQAVALLGDRATDTDLAAYVHWLVTIAEDVVGAARTGGVLGLGGDWVTESEHRFVSELRVALGD